ncbi:MAG: MFS transporter [Actinobacteria bacterium]|nr:MFS transporter [Actinomycetota bacterium]
MPPNRPATAPAATIASGATAGHAPAATAPARRTLPPTLAFYLQASIVLFFLAGSSAPTPLYSLYATEWHFTPITTTVIFGVYALAVLASLLVFGRLSDHIGRRPVLLATLGVQILAMLAFTTAGDVSELVIARIAQGVSTGAAIGAIGAGMLDINRVRGTVANAVAPITGTATGGIAAGLLVQYLPWPTHLVYVGLLAIFVMQTIGVVYMAETVTPKPGALASLRPEFALPRQVRRPMAAAVPGLIAAWALPGLYGSLGPALVRHVVGSNSLLIGGLALFVIAASAALSVLLIQHISIRIALPAGFATVAGGLLITFVSLETTSALWFFVGSAIAGVGFGAGFQSAIRAVVPLAYAHERSGVLSLLYVVSYLAMGLPAVIAGVLVVHGGGLMTTAREYLGAVIVLSVVALVAALRPAERPAAVTD